MLILRGPYWFALNWIEFIIIFVDSQVVYVIFLRPSIYLYHSETYLDYFTKLLYLYNFPFIYANFFGSRVPLHCLNLVAWTLHLRGFFFDPSFSCFQSLFSITEMSIADDNYLLHLVPLRLLYVTWTRYTEADNQGRKSIFRKI